MTSRDFCYWLQGYFEITESTTPKPVGTVSKFELTEYQVGIIRSHLNLVFKHEIDPSNYEGKSEIEKKIYDAIHDGAERGTSIDPYSVKYNC